MVRAIIFDVDGVLVDSPHEQAWGDTLRQLMETEWAGLASNTSYRPEDYTTALYQQHVAGRPRMDGARALLQAFGLPDDDSHTGLLAAKKQGMIVDLIEKGSFRAFEDAVVFLLRARACGIKIAAASSSRNANAMMSRVDPHPFLANAQVPEDIVPEDASLYDLMDANVCGRTFAEGKPHPEIFLTASDELDEEVSCCVVVEDSPTGVQAAKSGGIRCIGLARLGDEELLREAGADWVVSSLDLINPDLLCKD